MDAALKQKIERHIDNLFSGVEPSQELFDLKEELAANMRDKIQDLMARGLDGEQAFREAAISLGDLGALVEDMRRVGRERASRPLTATANSRLTALGIVAGTSLVLFGLFNILMLYLMRLPGEAVAGTGIFVVVGGAVLTYSILVRETRRRYAMHPTRAALYALAVGLVLFGLMAGVTSRYATGEWYIGVAALMFFFLGGTGLLLYLVLTERDYSKPAA